MPNIEVQHESGDRLSAWLWRFAGTTDGKDTTLRLVYYARMTRPTTRHKFKAEPRDRWDWMDERGYNSGITRREAMETVTERVQEQAFAQVRVLYVRRDPL